jgi:hypothetical protein
MKLRIITLLLVILAFCAIAPAQTPGTSPYPATGLDSADTLFRVKNRAATTLTGTLSSGATTASVASTASFDSTGNFTCDDEVIFFTGKTSNSFTGLIRGRDGSMSASHAINAAVRQTSIAAHHNVLVGVIDALETKLGYGASVPTTVGHVLTVTAAGQSVWAAPAAGGGNALTTDPLSQFAATTSAQLATIITNETGSGALVFGTSPTMVTPLIASFSNATHSHQNAAGGGTLDAAALGSGIVPLARLSGITNTEIAAGAAIAYSKLSLTGAVLNADLAGSIAVSKLNITGTPNGSKVLRDDASWQTLPGGGDALTASPLSQFATTTSAQLATVISNETGTSLLVFNTSPTIVTPTIASFVNANHFHLDSAGGGTLSGSAIAAGTVADARLSNNVPLLNAANVFTGTSNTITGVRDKGGQVFNVMAYGATGNGTADDLAALQAANTAAAAVKGIVYLPAGTYGISAHFTPSAGVTIQGAGRKASSLKALAGFDSSIAEGTMVQWSSASDITIRDLGFLSNSQTTQGFRIFDGATPSINCVIAYCYFDSGLQRMGLIQGPANAATPMRNIVIDHNVSEGTTLAENMAFVDVSYCSFTNNEIKQPSTANIHNGIELFLVTPGTMVGNKIIGNSFKNFGTGGGGVGLIGDSQTIVANNTIESSFFGIAAGANTAGATTGASITGNTIKACLSTGVGIQAVGAFGFLPTDFTISDNVITDSGGQGILTEGTGHAITGNIVKNSTSAGYNIISNYGVIAGNTAINNATGFLISGTNNAVNGNTATDTRGTKIQDYGIIFLNGANDNVYDGNTLQGNLVAPFTDNGLRNGHVTPGLGFGLTSMASTSGVTSQDPGAFSLTRSYWNGSTSVEESFSLQHVTLGASAGNSTFQIRDTVTGIASFAVGGSARGSAVAVGDVSTFPTSGIGQFIVRSNNTTNPTLALWKQTSQTSDLFRVYDTDGSTVKASIDASFNLAAPSIRGSAVTFANRPASPVEGMLVAITDSTTATWGATITGGGSNHVLGYYNGTNWTVAAK